MNIVVDSNLLIVLVSNDARSHLAQKQFEYWITQDIKLHAPLLAHYEIANAFTRLISAGMFPQEQLVTAFNYLGNLPITYHSITEEPRIIEIALSLERQSAYDAAYIALAEALSAELWTLDKRLYRNAITREFSVKILE